MEKDMVIQGRTVTSFDINHIKQLLADNPSWNRTKLSHVLCEKWHWFRPGGQQLKDMACRSLLLKLERTGCIKLPPRCAPSVNGFRKSCLAPVPHLTGDICCSLKTLLSLRIIQVTPGSDDHSLFNHLLSRYHYLGYRTTVGENLKYMIRDKDDRPLACLLFGSAAWKTKPRDSFIGWDRKTRESNLCYMTNNTRFLILPWVKVSHLASHILSRISRRICDDWIKKYHHPVYLLETFVDRSRYQGTCYKAANWILTGQTKGRTRNDRYSSIKVPPKDIYLYPLAGNFRRELCSDV